MFPFTTRLMNPSRVFFFLGWGGDAYRGHAVGAEGLYLQDRKAGVDQTALTGVEVLHRFVGI